MDGFDPFEEIGRSPPDTLRRWRFGGVVYELLFVPWKGGLVTLNAVQLKGKYPLRTVDLRLTDADTTEWVTLPESEVSQKAENTFRDSYP